MNNNEVISYDLGDDIQKKEEIIEEAKKLQGCEDFNEIVSKTNELKRRWKRLDYFESAYEDELNDEFNECIDSFFKKQKEMDKHNKEVKKELINQAKQLVKTTNFAQATKELNELMNKWKETGYVGDSELNEKLWNEFNEARQSFYDEKQKHWEKLQEKFAFAAQEKEKLIEKAKSLVHSTDWSKTSSDFKDLLDEWKSIGSAGNDIEEKLWDEFNEIRQEFYAKRNEFYDELHKVQNEHLNSKQELIEKAKEILESHAFTKEHTEIMKELSKEWKNVGSCGKDKEDDIWNEFRSTLDAYFDGLKQKNEEKHQKWVLKMREVLSHKQEMVNNQKRQIKRLQDSMVGLISQREVDDVQDEIEDREDFIKQLEEEIADIQSKLNK